MPPSFKLVLDSFGFPQHQLSYDTALGFLHEIYAYLSDLESIDANSLDVMVNINDPDAMVKCNAKAAPGFSTRNAMSEIAHAWHEKLNYSRPQYSDIRTADDGSPATIECITISLHTACTIKFSIEGVTQ